MEDYQCRLCSATTALISLFNGKNRKNRDIIRILTLETVDIEFEAGDAQAFICYGCVAQVYNIYIFKARAQDNDQRLKDTAKKYTMQNYKGKHTITCLNEIPHPTIELLKETFTPWLQDKLELVAEELPDTVSFQASTNRSEKSQIDQSTQIFPSIECDEDGMRKTVKNVAVQTLTFEISDSSVQCNMILEKRSSQTCLKLQSQSEDKYVQCDRINKNMNINIGVQAVVKMKNQRVQCGLKSYSMTNEQQKKENYLKSVASPAIFDDSLRICSRDEFKKNGNGPDNYDSMDAKSQFLSYTGLINNTIYFSPKRTQNAENSYNKKKNFFGNNCRVEKKGFDIEQVRNNNNSDRCTQSRIETDDISVQATSATNACLQIDSTFPQCGKNTEDIKAETSSPVRLSTKPMHTTDNVSCCTESCISLTLSSPNVGHSSLKIFGDTDKVSYDRICRHCNTKVYSISEMRKHKRIHTKCRMCKQSFKSIKQLNIHISNCEKLLKRRLMVNIVRLKERTLNQYLDKLRRNNSSAHRSSVHLFHL